MSKEQEPTDNDDTVIEHPVYKRAKAFAVYMARCHAHNAGKPMPDPDLIEPVCFAPLSKSMSTEEKVQRLAQSLRAQGINIAEEESGPTSWEIRKEQAIRSGAYQQSRARQGRSPDLRGWKEIMRETED